MNFSNKLTYLASVLSLVALGTGCEVTVEFDDRDGDGVPDISDLCPDVFGEGADGCELVGTLDGMWLINGVAASAATCAEAGIVNVRFNVDTTDVSGGGSWIIPCANQNFDSRLRANEPTIEFDVMYSSFWEALDVDDNVIAMTAPLDLVLLNPPQHATVSTPDFIIVLANELTIPLAWETDMSTGVFGTCNDAALDAAGDTVTIMLYLAGEGAPFADWVGTPCTESLLLTEDEFSDLAPGSYELDVAAVSADGVKWGNPGGCGFEYAGGAQVAPICNINVVP